jgi:hypothetical protein
MIRAYSQGDHGWRMNWRDVGLAIPWKSEHRKRVYVFPLLISDGPKSDRTPSDVKLVWWERKYSQFVRYHCGWTKMTQGNCAQCWLGWNLRIYEENEGYDHYRSMLCQLPRTCLHPALNPADRISRLLVCKGLLPGLDPMTMIWWYLFTRQSDRHDEVFLMRSNAEKT